MTWTTSADPWAIGIRKEARRTLNLDQFKPLIAEPKFVAAALPALAVGHLCLLAILTPTLAAPEACALLLLSGATLLIAAVAAIRGHLDTIAVEASGTHASTSSATAPDTAPPEPIALSAYAAASTDTRLSDHAGRTIRANAHCADWAGLMARVSHELRTPLNAVLGFSDLMDRGTFGPLGHHRYQEYARHIHDSGRDLLKSAEDTLAVTSLLATRSQVAASEIADLADLAADAWAFFGRLPSSRNVALAIDIPAGTEIVCDRRSLRQVLVNLLSEALSRCEPGMSISLSATYEFGQVGVIVAVPYAPSQARREPGSLDVCLARTLLEFHGAPLVEHLSEQAGWRATTYLEPADQADFFVPSPAMRQHRACA